MNKRMKIAMTALCLLVCVAASAQFEKHKAYVGASLSGLNLSYNGAEKTSFGLEAKGGYLFDEDWMALAQLGYQKKTDVAATLSLGVGVRYYIVQNGLYLGVGAKYVHQDRYDDFLPGVQVGYAFFLSRTVTVEPEIYYDQSFKQHSDYSTIGFRVGIGVYL